MEQILNSFSVEKINSLTVFCKGYFDDCLHYRKGYNVLYLVNKEKLKFDSYVSTCFEVNHIVDIHESKEESTNKIVYVIDCKGFRNYNKEEINEMSYNMAFVLFGVVSNLSLMKDFKLPDDTDYFITRSLK